MILRKKEKIMGFWHYQENRRSGKTAQEQQRRRIVIDEFFKAYDAARRTSPAFATTATPNPTDATIAAPPCLRVLGLTLPCTGHDVKQAFRAKAKVTHPDIGGSNEAFQAIYMAYQEALALFKSIPPHGVYGGVAKERRNATTS
jgi:hypothetical protein